MDTRAQDDQPEPEPAGSPPPDSGVGQKDEFLVPGPTSESNEGLARWGVTWLVFSILLMLLMLGITVVCFFVGSWLNLG